jgi:hypothetical protein
MEKGDNLHNNSFKKAFIDNHASRFVVNLKSVRENQREFESGFSRNTKKNANNLNSNGRKSETKFDIKKIIIAAILFLTLLKDIIKVLIAIKIILKSVISRTKNLIRKLAFIFDRRFFCFVYGIISVPLFIARKIIRIFAAICSAIKDFFLFLASKLFRRKKIKECRPQKIELAAAKTTVFGKLFKFALFLFLIILPFKFFDYFQSHDLGKLKDNVVKASELGFGNFVGASKSALNFDFSQANNDFAKADKNFAEAESALNDIDGLIFSLAKIVPNDKARVAAYSRQILSAGEAASRLGADFSAALNSLYNGDKNNFSQTLDSFIIHGDKANEDILDLNNQLEQINVSNLPDQYQENFAFLKRKTADLKEILNEFNVLTGDLQKVIGKGSNKRYLFVFQNNTEMRASGGFIGSYALVDFENGKLKKIETPGGGSYDTAGGMRRLVQAPEPLWLISPLWHFWDANWWPDWPTTAKKLEWFYEKSDGPTVDGVISFTPTVIEKMLKAIGPIDMTEEYGVIIDSENFWETVQTITEAQNLSSEDIATKNIVLADAKGEDQRQLLKKLLAICLMKLSKSCQKD